MKPLKGRNWSGRIQSLIPPAITIAMFACLCLLIREPAGAAGVVTVPTEANLRAAMAGGGTVTFACDGTVSLTSTITNSQDTILDGAGHQITISGRNAVRVFCVTTNVSFTAANVTIADGTSDGGSGILNVGGNVTLNGVILRSNSTAFYGGAILNRGGTMSAASSCFTANTAWTTPGLCLATNEYGYAASGGAIYNDSGSVNLQSSCFTNNAASAGGFFQQQYQYGVGQSGSGGALLNNGFMSVSDCHFAGNQASGANGVFQYGISGPSYIYAGSGQGAGGAIYNNGTLTVEASTFSGNAAAGGSGCGVSYRYGVTNHLPSGISGASGQGGAICNWGSSVIAASIFESNAATGGSGGDGAVGVDVSGGQGGGGGTGGGGLGGAIYTAISMSLINCTFAGNSVAGGGGGAGGGGSLYWSYPNNYSAGSGGGGGWGGDGLGGGVYTYLSGSARVVNCTFAGNSGAGGGGAAGGNGANGNSYSNGGGGGGSGGKGGAGVGGLFNWGNVGIINSTFASNTGSAGSGGKGGDGGGGYMAGGAGGAGGNGGPGAGAVYGQSSSSQITNCTFAGNSALGGGGGGGGAGGSVTHYPQYNPPGPAGAAGSSGTSVGGLNMAGGILANSLVAGNSPSNCSGTITDAGHNLSSDASCTFTAAGSLNNTDPKLGPLADNGGPTWTMALLPGSPAIDAGSAVDAPATDQRGVPRPQGTGVDIGAFEYLTSPTFTGTIMLNAATRQMQLSGLSPNPALTLQVSTNLLNWRDATNFLAGSNGVFLCIDPIPGDTQSRFYRLKSGTP